METIMIQDRIFLMRTRLYDNLNNHYKREVFYVVTSHIDRFAVITEPHILNKLKKLFND